MRKPCPTGHRSADPFGGHRTRRNRRLRKPQQEGLGRNRRPGPRARGEACDRLLCPTGHLFEPTCVGLPRTCENPVPRGTGPRILSPAPAPRRILPALHAPDTSAIRGRRVGRGGPRLMWRGAEAPPGHPAVWKRLQAWPRNCPCSKAPCRWQSTKTGLNWASYSHMQNPTPRASVEVFAPWPGGTRPQDEAGPGTSKLQIIPISGACFSQLS